jgi:hypothetical protein
MRREHAARRHGTYWIGADLVMEVMSPDDPKRDKDTKRRNTPAPVFPSIG